MGNCRMFIAFVPRNSLCLLTTVVCSDAQRNQYNCRPSPVTVKNYTAVLYSTAPEPQSVRNLYQTSERTAICPPEGRISKRMYKINVVFMLNRSVEFITAIYLYRGQFRSGGVVGSPSRSPAPRFATPGVTPLTAAPIIETYYPLTSSERPVLSAITAPVYGVNGAFSTPRH